MRNRLPKFFTLTTLLLSGLLQASAAPQVEPVSARAAAPSTPVPTRKPTPVKTATPVPTQATPAATVPAPTAPEAPVSIGSQFSLSLDALGQCIVYSPWLAKPAFGAGGQVFVDWRPIQYLSLGFGGQYDTFFNTPGFQMDSFDLAGRIFPLPIDSPEPRGEFYLQGGVGLNLEVKPPAYGHYHGYAGPGYRLFLQRNLALDMGAQYDFNSPIAHSSHSISAKFGITFLLGRTNWTHPEGETSWQSSAENGAAPGRVRSIQNVTAGTFDLASGIYLWKTGDSLQKVAAKVYKDPVAYPLLIDANKALFANPAALRDGVHVRVPELPTDEDQLESIHFRADHDPRYLRILKSVYRYPFHASKDWKGPASYRWKKEDDLASVALKLYGHEDYYPILVDANEDRLIHPANLKPGVRLVVPPPPTGEWADAVKERSWNDSDAIWWKNVSQDESSDYKWPKPAEGDASDDN